MRNQPRAAKITQSLLGNPKGAKHSFKSTPKPVAVHKRAVPDRQTAQQPPTMKEYKSSHEVIANKILSELSAMKTEIDVPSNSFQTSPSPSVLASKSRTRLADIRAKALSFANRRERCEYLFRELANSMRQMSSLEISTKKLRNENTYLKSLAGAYKTSKAESGNEGLKQEVVKLKTTVAQQKVMLDRFKREVIEKYCSKK